MLKYLLVLISLLSNLSLPALADEPSFFRSTYDSVISAHAVTGSARGIEALYYNPAGLGRPLNLFDKTPLIKIDMTFGPRGFLSPTNFRKFKSRSKVDLESALKDVKLVSEELEGKVDEDTFLATSLNIPSLVLPYFAMQGFADAEVYSDGLSDKDFVKFGVNAKTGMVLGFGIPIQQFSIGYSVYVLALSQVSANPSKSLFDQTMDHLQKDTFDEKQLKYSEFTEAELGSALGHNVGVQFRPFVENRSAIGVSLLNVGGTSFDMPLQKYIPAVQKGVDSFEKAAQKNGVEVKKPSKLPQMMNIGVCLDTPENEFIRTEMNIEFSDALGNTIKNKLALSTRFTLHTPDEFLNIFNDSLSNLGFISLHVNGGYRPSVSNAVAGGIDINGQIEKLNGFINIGFDVAWINQYVNKVLRERVATSFAINFRMSM